MGIIFETVPINSTFSLSEELRENYFSAALETPAAIQDILFSSRTGAFIRGIGKQYKLSEPQTILVSFAFLRVAIAETEFAQFASLLSSELKIPNDKAQKIAAEIEKDLFAPISAELNQYLKAKKQQEGSVSTNAEIVGEQGQQNVLDLKKEQTIPKPPPLPDNQSKGADNDAPPTIF